MGSSTKGYIVVDKEVEDKKVLETIYRSIRSMVKESFLENNNKKVGEDPRVLSSCYPFSFSLKSPNFDYGRFNFGYFVPEKGDNNKEFKFETILYAENKSAFICLDNIFDVNNFFEETEQLMRADENKFKGISISMGDTELNRKIVSTLLKDSAEKLNCTSYFIPYEEDPEVYEVYKKKTQKNKLKP